jgi:hypothetical protein
MKRLLLSSNINKDIFKNLPPPTPNFFWPKVPWGNDMKREKRKRRKKENKKKEREKIGRTKVKRDN